MVNPESVDEIHRLGGFVNEQHDGRKDQPVTGSDLFNFAVQLDSNFASIGSEFKTLRTEMNAEFKTMRTEMTAEFKTLRTEMIAEFKAVRAEMKEDVSGLRYEMSRIPLRTAAWVATTMIGLIGVICAVVAVVIAVV